MDLKPSKYNLYFSFNNKDYIYNTFSCELAEVDVILKKCLDNMEFNNISVSDINDLKAGGFILKQNINEHEKYITLFNKKKNEKSLSVFLLLTTTCNSTCIYCYQALSNFTPETLSVKQIPIITKWISREIINNKINDVHIELFGGEPLLAKSAISKFYELLNEIKSKYTINLTTAVVTNATLLCNDLIKIFVVNNVEIRITIDGVGNTHNLRRTLNDSNINCYEMIINNIKKIIKAGGINLISVRMNVDKSNLHEVESVARVLSRLGIKRFYCGRVLFRGRKTEYDKYLISNFDFDTKIDLKLYHIFKKHGYINTPINLEAKYGCQFHNKHGYVVSPSLKIAKCDELLSLPEHQIGYLTNKGILVHTNNNYNKQTSVNPDEYEECRNCKLLPICGAGCPIYSLNKKGTLFSNYCNHTEESIKLKLASLIKIMNE